MTIATVTLNPAIDQTITLDVLRRGKVQRASSVRFNAGGKGVNVASCLADWGLTVTATGLLGRDNAASFETLMRTKAIEDRFVRIDGATRTNIKLVDPGETTDVNLPGFAATREALAAVDGEAFALTGRCDLVVVAGSLPQGAPENHYAALLAKLSDAGKPVILDASGPALAQALAGPVMPYAIKPNVAELAELSGEACDSLEDIGRAARRLQASGIALVAVSMGAEGALFCSREGLIRARLPAVSGGSSVGAGDAMVAGMAAALAEGSDFERTARLASAFAVGKLGLAGPNLPGRDIIEKLAGQAGIDTL
jgi:1-phosphofructokinase